MKQTRMLAMPPRAAGLLLLATGATPAHHRCGVISLSVQIAVARLAGCARNLAASLAAAPSPPSRTASNCCLLKIARLRAAAAALFTTASAPTAAAQRSTAALQRRYSTNSTCSLQPVDLALYGFDVCQMTSRHIKEWPIEPGSSGTDDSPDGSLALRRVPITFGESDCELTLTGCNPNTCYTIFDLSSRSAAAAAAAATGSVCSRAPLFCDNTRSIRASAVLAEGRPDGCKSTELALALMHTHARARAPCRAHAVAHTAARVRVHTQPSARRVLRAHGAGRVGQTGLDLFELLRGGREGHVDARRRILHPDRQLSHDQVLDTLGAFTKDARARNGAPPRPSRARPDSESRARECASTRAGD